MRDSGWRCLRVTYQTLDPTSALLRALAAQLPGRWWHLPGTWQSCQGEQSGLEICVRSTDLPRAVSLSQRHSEVRDLDAAPSLLRPELFPGGVYPPCWPDLLSCGSARLVGFNAGDPVRRAISEVYLTWRGLSPDVATRRQGARWHSGWLNAVMPPDPADPVLIDSTAPVEPPGDPSWEPHARRLRSECEIVQPPALVDEVPLRIALIARLAHLQVVRILGPTALAPAVERRALAQLTETG